MMCYGLDRFSEDLDFDAVRKTSAIAIGRKFCKKHNFEMNVKKDTNTVQRFMIHYGGDKPLKVETSYRRLKIDTGEFTVKKGICVYTIEVLAMMKLNAYLNRDKLRDLFDTIFIVNNYWDSLTLTAQMSFQNAFSEKGFEYFELVTQQQKDDLIDEGALTENFFHALDVMGVQE